MASQEKNICNVLRNSWQALLSLVNYLSSFLRKILGQIQSLINRLKNTIIRRILNVIRTIRDIISNFLGLQTIDANSTRREFCRVLYACEPAVKQISKFVSPELFNKIFGPDSIKTIDLSKYGIASIEFNSKFELFEYVACRLSLRGLLDNITENLVNQLLEFTSQFDKYLDINWWLANTVWGRVLSRMIAEYESFFNDRVKPFLDQLVPYLDCTFALCDFKVSTNNFFDDFSTKFKAERSQTTGLKFEWKIAKEELYSDLTTSFNSTKNEMSTFKTTLQAPVVEIAPAFHFQKNAEPSIPENLQEKTGSSSQKVPYNSDETSQIKNNLMNRKSSLVPGLRNDEPIRPTIILSSPTTKVD
jgi:hypothetical protein